MTRTEILQKFKTNQALQKEWKDLIKFGKLDAILQVCECFRYPYLPDVPESSYPHIQSERNGGIKAWDKLMHDLRTIPFRSNEIDSIVSQDTPSGPEEDDFYRDSSLPNIRDRFTT